MADHVFGDEHRVEYFAVVHIESVAHKIRSNHRPARPRFDRFLCVRGIEFRNLFQQMSVHEWTLFNGTSHKRVRVTSVSLAVRHGER